MTLREPDAGAVLAYLRELQNRICTELERVEGHARFRHDVWERAEGAGAAGISGNGDARIMSDGAVFERAGVALSSVRGRQLPPSATKARPELAGRGFKAMGVSLVLHPR